MDPRKLCHNESLHVRREVSCLRKNCLVIQSVMPGSHRSSHLLLQGTFYAYVKLKGFYKHEST